MKSKIIKLFSLLLFFASSLNAEEITEWRDITFNTPSVDLSFRIKTNFSAGMKSVETGKSESIKIEPNYFVITGTEGRKQWYYGDCSLETLKYAYKLTEKSKSAKVTMKDKGGWTASEKVDVKSSPKYIFSVQTENPAEPIYEGFITEEEFTTLANMLLKDVSAASMKRTASSDTAKTAEFAVYLTKKLGELSELKKSPSAN